MCGTLGFPLFRTFFRGSEVKFRVNPLKFSLIWRDLVLAMLEVLPLLPEPVALEVLAP